MGRTVLKGRVSQHNSKCSSRRLSAHSCLHSARCSREFLYPLVSACGLRRCQHRISDHCADRQPRCLRLRRLRSCHRIMRCRRACLWVALARRLRNCLTYSWQPWAVAPGWIRLRCRWPKVAWARAIRKLAGDLAACGVAVLRLGKVPRGKPVLLQIRNLGDLFVRPRRTQIVGDGVRSSFAVWPTGSVGLLGICVLRCCVGRLHCRCSRWQGHGRA